MRFSKASSAAERAASKMNWGRLLLHLVAAWSIRSRSLALIRNLIDTLGGAGLLGYMPILFRFIDWRSNWLAGIYSASVNLASMRW